MIFNILILTSNDVSIIFKRLKFVAKYYKYIIKEYKKI